MVLENLRRHRFWLSVALGFVLLLLAFRDVELRQTLELVRAANLWPLVACLPVYGLVLWLRSWRWQFLLRSQLTTSTRQLFPIVAIGYMANNLLPARVGDLVRALMLGEKFGASKTAAFATVLLERLFDAASTLFLVTLLLPFLKLPGWVGQGMIVIAVVIGLVALAVYLLTRHNQGATLRLRQLVFWAPAPLKERAVGMGGRFLEGLQIVYRPVDAVISVVISMAIWTGIGALYFLVTIAMAVPASFVEVMLVAALVNVAAVIPSPPSQVGVFEFAAMVGFSLLASNPSEASTAALTVVTHTMLFIPAVAIGLLSLWWEGQPLSLLRRRDLTASPSVSGQHPETATSINS